MSEASLYREVLLDHFHNPRNKGELDDMHHVRRGNNPRCGDEIEVGVIDGDDSLKTVRFRGRGCSICLASASIMTETTQGLKLAQARSLVDGMKLWFGDAGDTAAPVEGVLALGSVLQHPARKKCVLLAWQALDEILQEIQDGQD